MLRGCAPFSAKQSIRFWIYEGNTSTYAFITATSKGLEPGVFVVVGFSLFVVAFASSCSYASAPSTTGDKLSPRGFMFRSRSINRLNKPFSSYWSL